MNLRTDTRDKPSHYSYGIHPWYISKEKVYDELRELKVAAHEKRCLAIGECGLDKVCDVPFDLQVEVFYEQIRLANEIRKPLIIHCVKAFNELINCLNQLDNNVPVIIHGFNNNENIARIMVAQGYYFSFGRRFWDISQTQRRPLKMLAERIFFWRPTTLIFQLNTFTTRPVKFWVLI